MTVSRFDIRVEHVSSYRGVQDWYAIEDQLYDVDFDGTGYVTNYAQAHGHSKWEAVENLIQQLKEEDRKSEQRQAARQKSEDS